MEKKNTNDLKVNDNKNHGLRKLIFEKIENLQRGNQTLKKFFVFSPQELEKDYEGCLESIEQYLEKHIDKIEDFKFDSWIDEITMNPVLMMSITLVPNISSHLINNRLINRLLPSSVESDILREEISNVLSRYEWELNVKENRKSALDNIKYRIPDIDDIEDRTNDKNIDSGILNFVIKKNGEEMTISEYLDSISSEKRYE